MQKLTTFTVSALAIGAILATSGASFAQKPDRPMTCIKSTLLGKICYPSSLKDK